MAVLGGRAVIIGEVPLYLDPSESTQESSIDPTEAGQKITTRVTDSSFAILGMLEVP